MLINDDKEPSPSQIPDCDPPPYGFVSGSAAVSAVATGLANAPTLKSIKLEKRHELISGTYIIDPEESGNEASALQGFATRHSDLVGLTKAADFLSAAPHAVFRNRNIKKCDRAIVDVSTRHGDIAVNLSSIHPGKRITLKFARMEGRIVVLLPPTFCGDVQISSGKFGGYDILPGLSSSIRSMHGKKKKTSLLIGDNTPTAEGSKFTDHCRLSTRRGRVVLGLSGQDSMPTLQREDTIWRKIGSLLRGGESTGNSLQDLARLH
ncbi:hypothetical protein BDR07DRAFT_1482793 [Suillus spraguei]|nr:hypothetical protein BDR07DRAFT_1482793 [Suillus spraguei]